MKKLRDNLYQFSVYIPPMDFTIHQYLLAVDPAILFAAGTVQQAKAILAEIKDILGDRDLKYVFISHMETDEVGGVFELRKAYPDVKVICGSLAARELPGWGYTGEITTMSGADVLKDGDLDMLFVDYPSEVHDQNGILCFERNSGIMYSADLFLRYGNGVGETIKVSWAKEVDEIPSERIVSDKKRDVLKSELKKWNPSFVAVGHGFCMECG